MAAKHDLRIISIEQLIRYRMERDRLVHELQSYRLESPYGPWEVRIYGQSTSDQRHASFSFGSWHEQDDVLVRMQSGALALLHGSILRHQIAAIRFTLRRL